MLSLACSLDQRAGLQRSRDAAKSQHISGLVEQVSYPACRLCTELVSLQVCQCPLQVMGKCKAND